MSAVWEKRVASCERIAQELNKKSPFFKLEATYRHPNEWRMVCTLMVHVMVFSGGLPRHSSLNSQCASEGDIQRVGPCQLGFRYHKRHLSCAPDPTELVTVLFPHNVFHPNIAPSGTMCVGHTRPGFSLEAVAHQVWGGLNMNGAFVNTAHGEVLNWRAAQYVRQNLHQFPFTRRGLFESET